MAPWVRPLTTALTAVSVLPFTVGGVAPTLLGKSTPSLPYSKVTEVVAPCALMKPFKIALCEVT